MKFIGNCGLRDTLPLLAMLKAIGNSDSGKILS